MELYIHIPFCIRKCAYCDFLSAPAGRAEQALYMEALLQEIDWTARSGWSLGEPAGPAACAAGAEERPETVDTIFIGGGTPSALEADWIVRLTDRLYESFPIASDAEISMEANPGTLTREKLKRYREAGVNRLSIGLQSMDDEELRTLGRIHTAADFLENFHMAREAGFTNINIDLMSALPGQSEASWERTLQRTVSLGPEHISAYSLIVEEGTPFGERYGGRPELLPSEEEDRAMYHRTKELLAEAGYERYEISNYARPGRECRHNTGYWTREPYLGFGLGAASFCKGVRFSNTREMARYLRQVNESPAEAERALPWTAAWREEVQTLTGQDAMEEFMFLGLRLTAGIRAADFRKAFGREPEAVYGPVLKRLTEAGLLERTAAGWRLSEWGLDVSNRVLAEFLLDE